MPESKFTPAQAQELAAAFAAEGVDYLFIGKSGCFPVASLEDIIASKRATGREKDLMDLGRLEQFRDERERR